MRPTPDQKLESIRHLGLELDLGFVDSVGTASGAFACGYKGVQLRMIASDEAAYIGSGFPPPAWEHVSVSTARRPPSWEEMCFVKDLFWLPEETVVQLHPPRSQWVNNHPMCLHLWRPIGAGIALPPAMLVGIASHGTLAPKNLADARTMLEQMRAEVARSLDGDT